MEGAERSFSPRSLTVVAALALTASTWLYFGYRYALHPQTATLEDAFALRGDFSNDFQTSLPSAHWAFTHFLALIPPDLLEPLVGLIWALSVITLWLGFLAICRGLGSPLAGGVAAGLVALPTGLAGFGLTTALFGNFYPTGTSWALAIAGLAALLSRRHVLAGALLGLATLAHPSLGLLMTAAVAPALLLGDPGRLRRIIEFGAPWLALAAVSVFHLVTDQGIGAQLPTQERLDLLLFVNLPFHFRYSAFTGVEYLSTGLWGGVLVISLFALRSRFQARALALVTAVAAGICGVGAIASAAGGPLLLISAQTARLSPLFVVLGIAAGATVLARAHPVWGPVTLLVIFLATPGLDQNLLSDSGWWLDNGSESALEAALVLVAIAAIPLIRSVSWAPAKTAATEAVRRVVLPAFLVAALVSLAVEHGDRVTPTAPDVAAFAEVAEVARSRSASDDVFITPPEQNGFRAFARRGAVVEFETMPYADGDSEWVRRMRDLAPDPRVLDPSLRADYFTRLQLIAASYDYTVGHSKLPIQRYGATGVVARSRVTPPPWLERVYGNRFYQLLLVRAPG